MCPAPSRGRVTRETLIRLPRRYACLRVAWAPRPSSGASSTPCVGRARKRPPRAFLSRSFQYSLLFLCLPDVVTKYSNFVSFPLYLNGRRMNTLQVRPAACGLGGHEAELLPVGPARQMGLGVAVRAPGWGVGVGRVVRPVGTPGSHLHRPHPALLAVFSHCPQHHQFWNRSPRPSPKKRPPPSAAPSLSPQ